MSKQELIFILIEYFKRGCPNFTREDLIEITQRLLQFDIEDLRTLASQVGE